MRLGPVFPPQPEEEHRQTLIVAGTARHAEEVAFSRRLPRGRWTFIHDAYQLQGIGHGHTILVYVTWHQLPPQKAELIRQLIKRAAEHGCVVEHVYESDIR